MSQQNKVSYAVIPGIRISEKNLLPVFDIIVPSGNGITYKRNGDGSVHVYGTAADSSYCEIVNSGKKFILPAGTYTMSMGNATYPAGITISANAYNQNFSYNKYYGDIGSWASQCTFEAVEGTYFSLNITINAGTTIDITLYPQLEAGSAVTEYEPYEIIEGFTRKIKKKYLVIDGVTCKITKKYRVVDGVTRLVYSATEDISAAEITLASGTLTYNGSVQTKQVASVVLNGMTLVEGTDYTVSGNTGTNAGSYTLTITGIGDYEGTAAAAWSIAKATGKISASPTTLDILGPAGTTATATISYTGDGSISVKSGSTGVATVSRTGNTITVVSVSDGSATITITLAAGTNYTGANCTIAVTATIASSTLDDNDWSVIQSIAANGTGANYWSVGDAKEVKVNGTFGGLSVNTNFYPFIIGFNHNQSIEGKGIHFRFTKKTVTGAKALAFCDSKYGASPNSNSGFVHKYPYSTNAGWDDSYIYNTVCPEFLVALPSELQGVISACKKYTDNTGNGSDTASNVTATTSKIWLMSEFEVFGVRTYANSAEKNYQKQYDYYANGNSTVSWKHSSSTTAVVWWLRSPEASVNTRFCCVDENGNANGVRKSDSYGFVPCFKIG